MSGNDDLKSKKPTGLPKLVGIKKPLSTKNIIPSDRLKPAINFQNALRHGHKSPESLKPGFASRAKLRRSRSVCDIREAALFTQQTGFKYTNTLLPNPPKIRKLANPVIPSTALPKTNILNRNLNAKSSTAVNTKSQNNAATLTSSNKTGNTNATNMAKKKIPAYDYKARFLDLQERHKALKDKYDSAKEQLSQLDAFEETQSDLIETKQNLKDTTLQLQSLQTQNALLSRKIDSLTNSLEEVTDELKSLKKEHEELSKKHENAEIELKQLREKSTFFEAENIELKSELIACRDQLFKSNIERKELHNTVLDLRGNIRVFCRVRPPLDSEQGRPLCGWNYIDESSLEISSLCTTERNKVTSHSFSFDHVFHQKSTQDEVFEMVSPLIQSALDGYNICIFAYGQTGSGKTFTMDGIENNIGVIPRTVDLIFESIRNYKRLGWQYKIKASFLEIYNENLYDLLSNEQKDMEIRMAKTKNDIFVSNITEVDVETADNLRELIYIAKSNRATAATAGNERSSRSHAVTRIELIGTHSEKCELSIGMINLVDLAGSESPKTSIRMNETKNINRSLSELTNVILALLQKQDHIPYRNSKLTHLLMPSLGGNSKTLMFINVSPFQDCFVESVKSLRFAASVNSCKMTKVRKNKFLNTSNSNTSASSSSSSSLSLK